MLILIYIMLYSHRKHRAYNEKKILPHSIVKNILWSFILKKKKIKPLTGSSERMTVSLIKALYTKVVKKRSPQFTCIVVEFFQTSVGPPMLWRSDKTSFHFFRSGLNTSLGFISANVQFRRWYKQ